jgi:predicted small secreted protein
VKEFFRSRLFLAFCCSLSGPVLVCCGGGSLSHDAGGSDRGEGGSDRIGLGYAPNPGGFYIAGEFTQVGTVTRNRIAKILPNGRPDLGWNPNANSTVWSLAVSGNTVYAGGSFSSIGGQTRAYLAALDASTGNATAWNPGANQDVLSLALGGNTVYAGGIFSGVGGLNRNHLAAVDASTGAVTAWKTAHESHAPSFTNVSRVSLINHSV